jgi:hypothetical protein
MPKRPAPGALDLVGRSPRGLADTHHHHGEEQDRIEDTVATSRAVFADRDLSH